jgi:hypothetical protein
MPAFVRGLTYSIRHRLRDVLPILTFTLALTLAYALMQGNVGTAYRQRTQITMFFFVFMGVGIALKQERRLAVAPTPAMYSEFALEDHDFVYPEEPEAGAPA